MAEAHAKDGLEVLAVNIWNEPTDEVRDFVKTHKLRQRVLLEGKAVGKQYGLYRIPTLIWIDKTGTVMDVTVGPRGPEYLEKTARELLATGG